MARKRRAGYLGQMRGDGGCAVSGTGRTLKAATRGVEPGTAMRRAQHGEPSVGTRYTL